ncbi:hypothetical protein D3C73_1097970 [compost metagenome]
MQILEDQHPPARLHVLVLLAQRRAGAELLQHIVEAGQGQVRMLGLHRLAGGVELLAEGAQAGAGGLVGVGEGEGIEAAMLDEPRSVLQRRGPCKEPTCIDRR